MPKRLEKFLFIFVCLQVKNATVWLTFYTHRLRSIKFQIF